MLNKLYGLFIFFLFLKLIIEYFKIFLFHSSLYFIFFAFIIHVLPFILFSFDILIL